MLYKVQLSNITSSYLMETFEYMEVFDLTELVVGQVSESSLVHRGVLSLAVVWSVVCLVPLRKAGQSYDITPKPLFSPGIHSTADRCSGG